MEEQNEVLTVTEYQEHVRKCFVKQERRKKERLSRRVAEVNSICNCY